MDVKSAKYMEKFMNENPTTLAEHTNVLGQKVTFLEHPRLGDDTTVFALIEAEGESYLVDTDFYEIETSPDYEPIIVDGQAVCGWELMDA